MWSTAAVVFASCGVLAACSPTFDWRELQPEGSGIVATFPCKPDHHTRDVRVGDQPLRMHMLVCNAGGTTFAVSFADVADPAAVAVVLAGLRAAALSNVAGTLRHEREWRLAGATPGAAAGWLEIDGRRPDGAPVRVQAAFFARGLRVYQASLLGPQPAAEATEGFFGGLRLIL